MIDIDTLPLSALLTSRQAAEVLNVPEGTLAQWRTRRCGPTFFKLGAQARYRVSDLREFLSRSVREVAA